MTKNINVLFDIKDIIYYNTENLLYKLTYGSCLQDILHGLKMNKKMNLLFSNFKSTQRINIRKINTNNNNTEYNFYTKLDNNKKKQNIWII